MKETKEYVTYCFYCYETHVYIGSSREEAQQSARVAGWYVGDDNVGVCPKHEIIPESPKGEG